MNDLTADGDDMVLCGECQITCHKALVEMRDRRDRANERKMPATR